MSTERRATLWLLLATVFWGSSFFSMQLGVTGVSAATGGTAAPTAFLFFRFLVAAALFPLAFPGVLRALSWRAAAGGLLLSIPFYAGFILQATGLRFTPPSVSAFLTGLTVAFTPALGRLAFRERLRWSHVGGSAVALAGVYVLTDPAGGRFGAGEALTAACAVAFALHIQLTNVVTRRADPVGVTWVLFLAATGFAGITLAILGTSPGALARALGERHVAWTVFHNATLNSIAAIYILNRFQRDVAPTRAAILYTLEPIFAAFFAVLLAGEPMTARKALGGAIIVAGNLVCELAGRRRAVTRLRPDPPSL
jgi:drug/metabolite transporter (DMT)-like permease